MEKITADEKIMTLNFENYSRVLLHPNDRLTGVDYEDKNANENENVNYDEKGPQKDDIKPYERVDAEELAEIVGVEDQTFHPIIANDLEKYAGRHENINDNKLDDINENEPDENIVTYVSDVIVSTK